MNESPVLSLSLPGPLHARLEALAARDGRSLPAVALQALEEFAERWEDYHATLAALDSGADARVALHVAPDPGEADPGAGGPGDGGPGDGGGD